LLDEILGVDVKIGSVITTSNDFCEGPIDTSVFDGRKVLKNKTPREEN
jgi:hypothetical protein